MIDGRAIVHRPSFIVDALIHRSRPASIHLERRIIMDARRWIFCLLTASATTFAVSDVFSQTATTSGASQATPKKKAAGTTSGTVISVSPSSTLSTQTATPSPAAPPVSQASATVQATPKPGELPANVFADGNVATTKTPAELQAEQQAEAKKAARLQKIQQLGFDRRPSAILKAWSTPEAVVAKEEPKPADHAGPNAPAPAPPDPFDAELKAFRRMVTLGDWPSVGKFLAALPEVESKAVYKRLVEALPNSMGDNNMNMAGMNPRMQMQMQMQMQGGQFPQFMERNVISDRDVLALASLAPHGRDKEIVAGLAQLLRLALDRGDTVENFVGLVQSERKGPSKKTALTDREAAKILIAAGNPADAKVFLPDPAKAEADNDREALNLLSLHYLAIYAKEKKAIHLEQAWKVTQAVLAVGEVDPEQKEEALKRSVELAPKVREELGLTWLEESFTKRPERGMEIIAAIGSASSRGMQLYPQDPDFRQRSLELQKTAVEALLKARPNQSDAGWARSLALLAGAWLAEAEFSQQYDTSTSLGPRMQRDMYGNFYYYNNFNNQNMMMRQQNFPQAIPVAKILQDMPQAAWLANVEDGVRPKFAAVSAQLYLKVGEDEKAFPYVENLAATHPERAREQAEEFLRVWTKNHDPNAERNMRNPYIYMFGFERKAESIPLTRSKQERNLKELAAWVARLRKLPIKELDEKLIARAFTACHSSAEVYKLEAIESVLGNFATLKPETLAEMAQQMRTNLAGLWKAPAVQEQNKTKRKEKDIRAEVLRGYEVARSVVDRGLEKHPDAWSLAVARAALMHDENAYRQEIDPNPGFSARRNAALAEFARAVKLYAAKVPSLSEDEETTAAFETWFHAGLGACELGAIDDKNQPDPRQFPLIRAAILALPGESAARHMSKFANALFLRMSNLNPSVKFRYLKGGFEIVQDHEQAYEARKVYDYYKDLVTEIKLEALVDGPAEVGAGKPFGVFVNLRHTREIERESGGFGRYLQNQNQGNQFFYNYGRPLENYRDKFTDVVKKAMEEHFDVMSVTFQDEKVNSRATTEYGWRYTPYAYVLLKARSPKVDKLPPLRLDLDFLDTSGYVIMPVESPAIPIDASTESPNPRPFEKLQVTQTLDERQAKDGKLILEVKAGALGLVPPLETILDVKSAGFEVAKTDDQGVSVSRFDPDGERNAILSERTWLVTMQALEGQPTRPEVYHFPKPKVETAEVVYQRYVDADLAKVEPEIKLEEQYGKPSQAKLWWAIGLIVGSIVGLVLAWRFRPAKAEAAASRFAIPDPITPFTVLGLLRDIQSNNGLSDPKKQELAVSIQSLEADYFAGPASQPHDLRKIAETWVGRSS
jgi:hypothetical protein